VAARGAISFVSPYLVKYYGTGVNARAVTEPLDTVTTRDRFALVEPFVVEDAGGSRWALDILFRMLQPGELAAATGFPEGYAFAGTKDEKVKQIGNAVPAYTACALTKAAVADIRGAA
jgi:DNA (cytosine-5)-methyltransferase 1